MPETLERHRLAARTALGSASFELRTTSVRLAPVDVGGTLHLAACAARVNAASGSGLLGQRQGPAFPEAPDPWLLAAARLHDDVSDAADRLINLLMEAEGGRYIPLTPEAAEVWPDDREMFGFLPASEGFDGWTDPQSSWDLGRLILDVASPAWRRRARIILAVERWAREHQAAVEAAGVVPLRECCSALYRVQVTIRDAIRSVRPGTVAASRAVARVAARSLVEIGDDAADLPSVAREYASLKDTNDPTALAWHAVAGLLAVSRDATPAREPEKT